MSLTPEEIATYTLKRAVRGYAIEDVDELLDRVADEVERLGLELDDARQRLVTYEQRQRELEDAEESVKRALLTATRAGDEALNEARERADSIIREAEVEAARRLEEAERLSEVRRDEIEAEMGGHRDEVIRLVEETEARLERLLELDSGYRAAMRTTLIRAQRELEAMDENAAGRMQETQEALDEGAVEDEYLAPDASEPEDEYREPAGADHPDDPVSVAADALEPGGEPDAVEDDPWAPPSEADDDDDSGDSPEAAIPGEEHEDTSDDDGDREEAGEQVGSTREHGPEEDADTGSDDDAVRIIPGNRTKGLVQG
jgi:cell division initiation protein